MTPEREELLIENFASAVTQGRNIALAVAIRRFRDEYKWPECEVRRIGRELVERLASRMNKEVDAIIEDIRRMVSLERNDESIRDMIVSAFALAGAQESERFEICRRVERN
jgi:hypothetical protein